MAEPNKILNLHTSHIQGIPQKGAVKYERILIAHLADATIEGIRGEWNNFNISRVYITTYALKHIFDKRQAQEYDAILCNIAEIINQPSNVFENVESGRGELILTKSFTVQDFEGTPTQETFFCSLQIVKHELDIVTVFRFKDIRRQQNYLKKYKLLWSWGDGRPPS